MGIITFVTRIRDNLHAPQRNSLAGHDLIKKLFLENIEQRIRMLRQVIKEKEAALIQKKNKRRRHIWEYLISMEMGKNLWLNNG